MQTLFYCKFLKDKPGRDTRFWTAGMGLPSHLVWAGFTFDLLCRDHIRQIKKALGIEGVLTDISVWSIQGDEEHDGAQIDLLIDRQDRVINLCEIKFSDREFVIEKEYDRNLRSKIGTFIDGTGCRKSVMLT